MIQHSDLNVDQYFSAAGTLDLPLRSYCDSVEPELFPEFLCRQVATHPLHPFIFCYSIAQVCLQIICLSEWCLLLKNQIK